MAEQPTSTEVSRLLKNMRDLLDRAGTPGVCRGCKASIWWIRHMTSGANAPYDSDGTSHFATCPNADDFRSGRKVRGE